jgi:hypothetical protein
MSASSTIATIGATLGCQLVTHEMFASCSAMSAATKNLNLVYKIRFFHSGKGQKNLTIKFVIHQL